MSDAVTQRKIAIAQLLIVPPVLANALHGFEHGVDDLADAMRPEHRGRRFGSLVAASARLQRDLDEVFVFKRHAGGCQNIVDAIEQLATSANAFKQSLRDRARVSRAGLMNE